MFLLKERLGASSRGTTKWNECKKMYNTFSVEVNSLVEMDVE